VEKVEDLHPGMKLPGIVTNVTAFGAFVDVGVHQDGLVHISQLANHFVKDPHQVVRVSQQVTVKVMEVDLERKRISLSMREAPEEPNKCVKKTTRLTKQKAVPQQQQKTTFSPDNPFIEAFRNR
jgi:uncharacterized protein